MRVLSLCEAAIRTGGVPLDGGQGEKYNQSGMFCTVLAA